MQHYGRYECCLMESLRESKAPEETKASEQRVKKLKSALHSLHSFWRWIIARELNIIQRGLV